MHSVALEAHGVGVAYAASRPVLDGVGLVLTPGFYGLVGANGAGKTTLLRVLAGRLAHEGAVVVRPRDATIAFCPQEVDVCSEDVLAFAASTARLAQSLKGRLALVDVERWHTLSPGERKRWQIGAALAAEPDVLLLDEPTNHLDADARGRLLGALQRFAGIGVVVSHDRDVLERLPQAIVRVHGGKATLYPGAYSEARALWEGERATREQAHERARADVRAAERRLDRARRVHEGASKGTNAGARMKDRNDHDARDMLKKNMARWADARAGKTVGIVRDEVERLRGAVPTVERDRTLGGTIFAAFERAPNKVLFHLDEPVIERGGTVILRDVRLTIERDQRLRVAGPNGAGKTTLLESLPRSERVLWLPQELAAEEVARHVEALRTATDLERGRILSVFAALGSDPERVLGRSDGLSPGEARKLVLASGLGRHAWALVLDEPTNHLDLPTIERLERALVGYPGCVVLVTHDDAFAAAVTTTTYSASRVSVMSS